MTSDFYLTVVSEDPGEANRLANELERTLLENDPHLSVSRYRADNTTMDMGATLAIIIGSAAVTAIAQGIKAWLARNPQSGELLLKKDGSLEVRNLRNESLERIAALVVERKL